MFPLAGSSPASPGQAPPLVLLLLLPLADRWRDESHGTVRHSRWAPTRPSLADTLTACPAASATCSGASASPCRSSAARPAGCGTPPPWRPAGPQTSCSRAEGGQGRQQVLSNCIFGVWGWGGDLLVSHRFLLSLPPAVFLVGVQRSRQVDVRLLLNGLQQDLLAGRQQTVQAHQLHLCTGRFSV